MLSQSLVIDLVIVSVSSSVSMVCVFGGIHPFHLS